MPKPVHYDASDPADKLNRFFEHECSKLGVESMVNSSVGGIVRWYAESDVSGTAVKSGMNGSASGYQRQTCLSTLW